MIAECNWRLEAISQAAKNRRRDAFVLRAGENRVGKQRDSHIKIASQLCSREHCRIFLDGNKVTLIDTSRNGTYITFSNETRHFRNTAVDRQLEQNDVISFGFNTATVYDVNDRNAFIYRLVKEQIETIDIDDSDDDNAAPPVPSTSTLISTSAVTSTSSNDKIIDVDNRVIDIDSDSDSNYSGDEYLQNIDDMKDEEESISSSVQFDNDNDFSGPDDYSESNQGSITSDDYDDDDNFVVTKTIINCATPTETISLDEEDEEENDNIENVPDVQSKSKTGEVSNGTTEKPSTLLETDNSETKDEDEKLVDNGKKPEAESSTSQEDEYNKRLENIKRKSANKVQQRKVLMTKPQPLRKRRQTISEEEYFERKKLKNLNANQINQMKREKLAKLGERDKAKRDAAAENAGESNRIRFKPKVKVNSVSRGEQLCTDFLALSNTNS